MLFYVFFFLSLRSKRMASWISLIAIKQLNELKNLSRNLSGLHAAMSRWAPESQHLACSYVGEKGHRTFDVNAFEAWLANVPVLWSVVWFPIPAKWFVFGRRYVCCWCSAVEVRSRKPNKEIHRYLHFPKTPKKWSARRATPNNVREKRVCDPGNVVQMPLRQPALQRPLYVTPNLQATIPRCMRSNLLACQLLASVETNAQAK